MAFAMLAEKVTTMKNILMLGLLAGLIPASLQGVEVFSTDFESGVPAGIGGEGFLDGTQGYVAHGFGNSFFHNNSPGNGGGVPTTLSLSGLPAHTAVSLAFSVAIINSWDGDTATGGTVYPDFFNVRVNGNLVFSESFDNFASSDQSYTGTPTTDGTDLFDVASQWDDSAYDISIFLPSVGDTLMIEWFSSGIGWQGLNDESFALDNIRVNVRETTAGQVPEVTSTLGLLLLGMAGVFVVRRR